MSRSRIETYHPVGVRKSHIVFVEQVVAPLTTTEFVDDVKQRRETILGSFSINDLQQEFAFPQEAAAIVTDYLDEALANRVLKETPVESAEGVKAYYRGTSADHRTRYNKLFQNQGTASTKEGFLRAMAKSLFEGHDAIQRNPEDTSEIVERTTQRCKDAAKLFLL